MDKKDNKDDVIKSLERFTMIYKKQANDSNKKNYLSNQVKLTTQYIPYVNKMAIVKNIVDATSFNSIEVDGKRKLGTTYKKDSPMQYILYVMTLIDKYTNIEIKYEDETYSLMTQYDYLKECGVLEKILNMIPASEMNEFATLLRMQNEDTEKNCTSAEYAITNIINQLSYSISDMLDKFNIEEFNSKINGIKMEKLQKNYEMNNENK